MALSRPTPTLIEYPPPMFWLLAACTHPGPEALRPPVPEAGPSIVRSNDPVVVIGAGVSGMAAAVEARAHGARVVVLEREVDRVGGAAEASKLMMFSGSEEQAAAGIIDSPEQLLIEWPDFTGGDVTDLWVQQFATQNVPMVRDWLWELGVTWESPGFDPSAGTTARIHSVSDAGVPLVDSLRDQLPDEVIRMGIEATDLVQDEHGRITGVQFRDVQTEETGVVAASAVVVATGGFGWNLERVRELRPDLQDVVLTHASWSGADGNGIDMLEAVGAVTQNIEAVGLYAHASRCPYDVETEMRVAFQFSVPWVSDVGERFVDESGRNDFHTAEAIVDEGGVSFMVFDEGTGAGIFTCDAYGDAIDYTFVELVESGLVLDGADLAELAGDLGVDPSILQTELDSYNAAVRGEQPDDWRATMEDATPIDTAPYFAMPVAVSVAKMFGGIDVDLRGRVLDHSGRVIPGLYAAGELTGMAGGSLVGDAGFTGSLSAVILGGRVAGADAAGVQ